MFFVKKDFLKLFRNDGFIYQKSSDGKRIREDHIPLKFHGEVVLTYYSTQTELIPKMHRRIYKLSKESVDCVYLFHYLQDEENILLTIPEPSYQYRIIEYSPQFSSIYGNQTILMVLSEPLFNYNIFCEFDGVNVKCENILPQVLKCQSPYHLNGEILIQLKDGISNTYLTPKYPFAYYNNYNAMGQKRFYDDVSPMNEKIVECKKRLVIQNIKSDISSPIQSKSTTPLISPSTSTPPILPLPTTETIPMSGITQENDHENIINNAVKNMLELIKTEDQFKQCEELDENGYSLLHYASIYNYSDLISILINGGFSVNQETINKLTPLYLAIENESIKSIYTLLSLGAIDTKDNNGIYASSKYILIIYNIK